MGHISQEAEGSVFPVSKGDDNTAWHCEGQPRTVQRGRHHGGPSPQSKPRQQVEQLLQRQRSSPTD